MTNLTTANTRSRGPIAGVAVAFEVPPPHPSAAGADPLAAGAYAHLHACIAALSDDEGEDGRGD